MADVQISRRKLFGLVGALAAVAALPAERAAAAPTVPAPEPVITPAAPSAPVGGLDYLWIEDQSALDALSDLMGRYAAPQSNQILMSTGNGSVVWKSMPEILGEPITVNSARGSVRANVEAIRAQVSPKVGEAHFTLTVDTSQFRADLAELEARARRLAMVDDARWSTDHAWGS